MSKDLEVNLLRKKVLIIFVILVILTGAIIWYLKSNQSYYITDNEWLYDEAISYLENKIREESEYKSEADYQVFTDYKGFGIQENGTKKYAYMWILEEEYYAKGGEVQSGSGSSMAYKFIFENNQVIDYEIPKDGSYYTPSIKKMFPSEVVNEIFRFNMDSSKLDEKVKKHYEYLDIDDSASQVSNTTNPYIPDGIEVVDPNDNSGIKASDMKFNRSPENVTIKVIGDTISRDSASILITDNNEDKYGWGEEFGVQEKVNGEWKDLDYISDNLSWIDIAYELNDNELTQKLNIKEYYGELSNGIYRIVKRVYDNGYVSIYSDEFEVK